jgi:serine/threonine protein kinase
MMLSYDPDKRPSAEELMAHSYFSDINEQYYEFEKKSRKALNNKPKTKQNTFESMKITDEGIRIMTTQDRQAKEP